MTTLIRPIAAAAAGEASHIAVEAFNDSEVLTALRNGSGNLELISWHTAPQSETITRGADSGTLAGTAQEVALTLMGRRAITAVRSGSDNLLLISWDVPPGLATISRTWDSGTAAGEASQIAMTAISDTVLVTALRAGNSNLLLISWHLEPDGTILRLHDSGSQAGEVSLVTIAPVDANNIVTAVRNGSGNLELIGWSVSSSDGSIQRWTPAAAEAGEVSEIAMIPITSSGLTTDVVTAVRDGSGNLLLIAWRLSPAGGTIERLVDSGSEAGTASDIAICSTITSLSGRPTVLVSMRRGSGNLELIAFDLITDATGSAILIRTGDMTNEVDTDVTDTALAGLEPGRIVSASQIDNNLQLTTYSVSPVSPTLIQPIAAAAAGEASHIAVEAFNDSEVLTALRNGSGNLELISWRTAPQDYKITRGADSGTLAGTAQEVALTLMGRRAITAVRSGSDRLLLISWDVPPGLTAINRISDSGSAAGEASQIAMTAISDTMLVTTLRAGNGNLLLISWRLEPDGTMSRLHDSGSQAGEVSLVTVAALDTANVVTAVRNGSGNLELIGWNVSSDGSIQRWGDSGNQAGEVGEIALIPLTSGSLTSDVLTAVQDGSGNLLLITWRLSPTTGTIERLADSGSEAGTASHIALTSTVTPTGTPTILASMRRGSGNLELISFHVVADTTGSAIIIRSGDYTNRADTKVTGTALLSLDPGRILSASRIDHNLQLATYSVSDAATMPAPATILEIQYKNPDLPPGNDSTWASSGGNTYPTGSGYEWVQVLAPAEEYDHSTLVGGSGWVIAPDDSGGDVPFDHPFGFDWEFQVALDDDEKGYTALLSPANAKDEGGDPNDDPIQLADALGLAVPHGLLGVEWDKGLLPQSFRAQVNHGDRVAIWGRWILDTGHDDGGYYRTEIHPPLLVATGSVQQERHNPKFTRVLFMSRPYLAGQTYTVDLSDAYYDAAQDDGSFFDHLVNELAKVILLESRRVEAHPKIKSYPFRGAHRLHIIVRPPPPPASGHNRLAVSFQFTVRTGCNVEVTSTSKDRVDVFVTLNEAEYAPPHLPNRKERSYSRDELDKLSARSGIDIILIDALTEAIASLVPWGGIGLDLYVAYILSRGIKTDEYNALPEINIRDSGNAVWNVFPENIRAGMGVTVDNEQRYPIYGWLEAKWVPLR